MTKQDIFRYVLSTPENINPAILGQMLDKLIEEAIDENTNEENSEL